MRISVIIPTYNRATLIGETLDRIVAQAWPPDEIIVVDDGSTDETAALIKNRYPIVRLVQIANSGDMVGRNVGLRAASGDLVAFCDSDDLWQSDHLATMVAFWRAAPALRFAYSNFQLVLNGNWQRRDKFADAPAGFWDGLDLKGDDFGVFEVNCIERLLRFQPFFPSALVADRLFLISTGGWDEGINRGIGWDFATALRLVEHPPFGVVRRPTVGIRKHASNLSADTLKMNLTDASLLEHCLATRPSLAPYAESICASIVARRRDAFETAFARGDVVAAWQIEKELPLGLGGKMAIKRAIIRLPVPIRRLIAKAMTTVTTVGGRH